MHHTIPLLPKFYVTAPQPCPYLEGQLERKLFTSIQGNNATKVNNILSKQGFRRSQNVLYRPACTNCTACLSARIDVKKFQLSKTQRRVSKKNSNLKRHSGSPWATEAQYNLFRTYLDTRHANGGMADMDIFEFAAMMEETSVTSQVTEYTTGVDTLEAVCLTDIFDDGVSLVYSFFNTDFPKKSLGTYIILDHIKIAQQSGLPYVYLGYWVPGSKKMSYKAQFKGVEVFYNKSWISMEQYEAFLSKGNSTAPMPLAAQVAEISMPNTTHIPHL